MCVEIVTRGLPYHAVKEDEMAQQSSDLFCYNLDKIDLPVFQ